MIEKSKGAVATGHELTTSAALTVLLEGGNAVDGAIAAAFAACFCEPVLASPGGGGFAMVHDGSGTSLLDFFAQTPTDKSDGDIDFVEIHADFGTAVQAFHIGAASSATPGFIAGLYTLHKKHGSLPMADLIEPARKAAKAGVVVTRFQHFLSTVVAPILLASDESARIFAPNGDLLQEGETFQNPQLAEFFTALAREGEKAFPVGDIIAAQKNGGHLRAVDFDNYQVIERAPLTTKVAGAHVNLNPLPAAGGVMISCALAQKHGNNPVDLAKAMAGVVDMREQTGHDMAQLLKALGPPAYRGTTHISVVDGSGNACSMTLSNGEGNGSIVGEYGFMLNNMLGEADINPGGKLGWPVNTRMSSMMCPTIVEQADGGIIALGSGGSNRIRSAIFQVLVNLLEFGQTPVVAVDGPRLHVEGGHLDFEDFFERADVEALQASFIDNRAWPERNLFFGGCHVAAIDGNGKFAGSGDARRAGVFASC